MIVLKADLNTSNVNVNLEVFAKRIDDVENLNTSNVNVNREIVY